jgi:putative DNA primase/helicase
MISQNSDGFNGSDEAERRHLEGLAVGAECLAAAIDYLRRGWSPLALCPPDHVGVGKEHAKSCGSPGKRPWHTWKERQVTPISEAALRELWRQRPNSNVGLALGPVSGLIGADVDSTTGEAKLLELSAGDLPATLEFRTPGGGRRLLYALPAGVQLRQVSFEDQAGESLRFQTKGGQTVVPPSRHRNGGRYSWVPGHGPGEIEAAPAPEWLIRHLTAPTPRASARPSDGGPIPEGCRDSTLTRLAGVMRQQGFSEAAIYAAISLVNQDRCRPPLADAQVQKIARSVASYDPDPFVVV